MKRIVKANQQRVVSNSRERKGNDAKQLLVIKSMMEELRDELDDTRYGFLDEYDLHILYDELDNCIYSVAHDLNPFDGSEEYL